MKLLNRITVAIYTFLVMALIGCTEEPVPIAVTSVSLNSTSMELIEGSSQTLVATVSPSNADNQKVIWTSNNSSVATVTDGVVTAIKAGTATITVKTDEGGKTATVKPDNTSFANAARTAIPTAMNTILMIFQIDFINVFTIYDA